MKRLRRNTRNKPIPMKAKLNVARKHIPMNSVFMADAMFCAVVLLKFEECVER